MIELLVAIVLREVSKSLRSAIGVNDGRGVCCDLLYIHGFRGSLLLKRLAMSLEFGPRKKEQTVECVSECQTIKSTYLIQTLSSPSIGPPYDCLMYEY